MSPRKKPMPRLHRVNARLDSATFELLTDLEAYTSLSTTNIVREALRRMHAEVSAVAERNSGTLDRLVGKYRTGQTDLSTNYKRELSASLSKKHPQ